MTRQVTRAARTAWTKAQGLAALSLCMATGMVLPLALVSIGFHSF